MNDVKNAIRQFIISTYLPGESPENLKDDTPLRTSGILDSMSTLGLVNFVEESFGVKIPDEEIDAKELLKLDNLAAYVAARAA